jgi:hypothetical protein
MMTWLNGIWGNVKHLVDGCLCTVKQIVPKQHSRISKKENTLQVKREYPTLLANELVPVKPLAAPKGKLHYLDFDYWKTLFWLGKDEIAKENRVKNEKNR